VVIGFDPLVGVPPAWSRLPDAALHGQAWRLHPVPLLMV